MILVHLITGQLFSGASVHLGFSDVSLGLDASLTGMLYIADLEDPGIILFQLV